MSKKIYLNNKKCLETSLYFYKYLNMAKNVYKYVFKTPYVPKCLKSTFLDDISRHFRTFYVFKTLLKTFKIANLKTRFLCSSRRW